MIRLFAICLFCFAANSGAQVTDIATLRSRCIPTAPVATLSAIVQAESGGNPNAMQIDFPVALLKRWHLPQGTLQLKRQPVTQREALAWLTYFEHHGVYVDLGLMQVSTAEAQRRGIPVESLLEPCLNLRAGWQILQDAYQLEMKTYGPGQEALRHAISRYNTGDSQNGIDNGYLARVIEALKHSSSTSSARGGNRK